MRDIACLLGTIGLAPAILGLWSNYNGLLKTSDGQDLCESQDQVIGVAVQRLLPPQLTGKEHVLVGILILESLNTVDTSILMCAKVMASQARRCQIWPQAAWADHAAVVLALGLVSGVSKLGDNVWELAEEATAAVGAPLALLCMLIPFPRHDRFAAGLGASVAQAMFLCLKSSDIGEMPLLWAIMAGGATYAVGRLVF